MNETKATRYQRLRRRVRVAEGVSAAAALGLVAYPPVAGGLANAVHAALRGTTGSVEPVLALTVFVVVLVGLVDLATLPASLYAASRVDARYRDAAISTEHVMATHLQTLAVVLPSAWLAGAIVLSTRAMAPRWWWAIAGLLLALALVAALHLTPHVLARLAAVRPLDRPDLVRLLQGLARRAGVPIGRIVEWQVDAESRATAIVTGLGRSRQILLSSELVRDWRDEEISVVVAHEFGHIARGDLWRTVLLDAWVIWGALLVSHLTLMVWLGQETAGAGHLAALPTVAFVSLAVWTVATPLRHAQSRTHERQADRFALELTGNGDAFAAALRRLGSRHLAEERPSALTRWFYYRHPSLLERLEAANAYTARGLRTTRPGATAGPPAGR
jgi:STE24 endopeptidase